MKLNTTRSVAVAIIVLSISTLAPAQKRNRKNPRPAPSTSITFILRDKTCITGPIVKIDPKVVTIQPPQSVPVTIPRTDLLQASQNGSLIFSARSSWADVEATRFRPQEQVVLKLRNGNVVTDTPLEITPNSLGFKWILWWKKRYRKSQIVTVDYLRHKPDSDAFDYFSQESPDTLLYFYPDFYDRQSALVGRIPVRLYDALKPEDDSALQCPSQ